ncbi:MAG: hypothetical protein ACRCVX_02365 [Shewanella sp.]
MDWKDEHLLKPLAIVATFSLAVVARKLLNEEQIKFRAFIGELILAVIFGLLLVFTGVIRGYSFAETMTISCICGLGINRSVQWIVMPIIQRFIPRGK